MLSADLASQFAQIALGHVTREYPHKLDHVMLGPADVRGPRDLHPIFFGSYDWHSCVHGYWLLLRVRRACPGLVETSRIDTLFDMMITAQSVEAERAYLDRPSSAGFERPYGWAWVLALHAEAARSDRVDWAMVLEPLARAFAARFAAHLPRLTYPIRVGTHYNTAFAMILAHDWAADHDPALAALIEGRAQDYFSGDHDCQAWEPGGDEFLSSALTEAHCMARLLPQAAFAEWFNRFLPRFAQREPDSIFTPATVSDRSDGKIAHLDGCNLSRAWCLKVIADALGGEGDAPGGEGNAPGGEGDAPGGEAAAVAQDSAERHLAASLPHIAGDYMGEHWLATFACLAVIGLR